MTTVSGLRVTTRSGGWNATDAKEGMLRTAFVGGLAAVLWGAFTVCLVFAFVNTSPQLRLGTSMLALIAVLATLLWGQNRMLDQLRRDIIDTLDAVRDRPTVPMVRAERMTVPMVPVSELARRSVIYASAPVPPPVPPIPAVELPPVCEADHAKI